MTTDELTWLPAWRINELVVNKEVSPVEVTEHFLGRIEELEPTLHAFRTLDAAGAREQAQQAEDAIRQGAAVGPLHGIPVAVKEHIAVKGLPFSLTGPQHAPIAKRDDILTERLRAAGAIMVGTTVMPGMGNSPTAGRKPSDDLSDQPRNPWDPTRVPGSSSAGSAAATASGMLPFTIGSDGGGSTRLPSALSGVVGLHTTARRIPFVTHRLEGLPLTGSFGPITRDVRDAAIALQVMAGPDGRDFVCLQDDPPDYSAGLDAGRGRRAFRLDGRFRFRLHVCTGRDAQSHQRCAGSCVRVHDDRPPRSSRRKQSGRTSGRVPPRPARRTAPGRRAPAAAGRRARNTWRRSSRGQAITNASGGCSRHPTCCSAPRFSSPPSPSRAGTLPGTTTAPLIRMAPSRRRIPPTRTCSTGLAGRRSRCRAASLMGYPSPCRSWGVRTAKR